MISTTVLLAQIDVLRQEVKALTEERDILQAILVDQPPQTPDKN